MPGRIVVASLAALLSFGAAHAGEIQDLAGTAEALSAAGKHEDALSTMREALLALWSKSPLRFRKAVLVSVKATGFGLYDQRASSIYKSGEKILIYAEPVGFGWSKEGDLYTSDMAGDFDLRRTDGRILGGKKDFGRFKVTGYHRNTEYYVTVTYNFTGLKPGKYIIGTTFRDAVSGKSGSFDLPFEIR